ncbi:uncharacterized protein LOC130239010 isoform X4 [Danio aesculapii]|uniref:uncharacterized protein LOC130239010 isoform X4 n=1 Tax=Danio aesculapii TaxID=1142201 RepID=UPI0024C09A8E|nr:uncharacterized protein LOC130239010 isoform X4 [Danio aesculapii]
MNTDYKDRRITTMNATDAVLLFILLCTSTVTCQANESDVCSVSCNNVTGTVGKEVIFTCRVSEQCTEGCVTLYKFQYPEIYNDVEVCKHKFPNDACEKKNIFMCRYTSDTAMTKTFRFFLQTECETKTAEFTVEISVGK